MPETYRELIGAIYVTQMVANLLLALVLFGLYRIYRRTYLLHWSLGWLAMLVYHLGGALSGILAGLLESPLHPVRIAVSSVCVPAGYAHAALLVTGTWLLIRGPTGNLRRVGPWIAASTLALGLGSVLASAPLELQQRLFARVGLRAGFAGLAFLATAYGVVRHVQRTGSAGRWLVAGFFALSGIAQLRYSFEQAKEMFVDEQETILTLVVPHFVDLLLQLMLALSLLVWFFEDERRKLARTSQALFESQERLRQSEHLEAVGQLAGGVAHDFNNLLTVVRGHGELLLNRPGTPEDARRDATAIVQASERAGELVHDLLAFSRKQPLRPTVFEPGPVLREMRAMIDSVCGAHVRVVIEPDDPAGAEPLAIEADRRQFELAVLNLAANARDAIEESGTLRIRVGAGSRPPGREEGPDRDDVLLEFTDSGCGIPPDSLHQIFDPFYTTKTEKGTGLGLSSVFGIVKQAGGDVRVESRVGRGTTFRLWLPRSRKPLTPPPRAEDAVSAAGTEEVVLLVEDDPSVRSLARVLLEESGYRVLCAGDGRAGLDLARSLEGSIDVLVTDVMMPGISVSELVQGVREHSPGVQVVVMSGYAEATILQRGIDRASTRFVAKPFTPQEFLAAVRSVLEPMA